MNRVRELPWAVRVTTGAAIYSTVVFLLLALHAGYWPAYSVGLGAVVWLLGTPGGSPAAGQKPWPHVLALVAVVYAIYALAPEIQGDAVGYHLRLVSEYFRNHGFTGREGFYDALPQGMEMLFVPIPGIAKLAHFGFLLLTVPLIRLLAREAGLSDSTGWAAAALFLLAPVCAVDGTSAYTDMGLVCASCATVYLLARWNRERSWPLLIAAAINAGFCFCVKPTFGWVAVCGFVFVAKNRRSAAAFGLVAMACAAPWLVHAYQTSGSLAGPFFSGLIPNRILTPEIEAHLTAQYSALRPAFSWSRAWLDYTVLGGNQGFFGPAFLLSPLLFFAKPRWLAACAALLAVPIACNTGARFLMPAMALAAIGITSVLPRRAAIALVAVQVIAALPPAMDLYARPGEWRLGTLPLAAALGLEPADRYLRRSLREFDAAKMIERNTPEGAKILACVSLPDAYISREVLTWWHSRRAQQFADALHFAMMSKGTRARLVSWRWKKPYRPVRVVALTDLRIVSASAGTDTWRMRRPGESIGMGTPAAGLDLLLWPGDQSRERVEALQPSGEWCDPGGTRDTESRYLDLRQDATAYIRRSGYRYIAAPVRDDPFAEIGVDMVRHPYEWGVEIAGEASGIYLLRIRAGLF
jgi:hypothetical protein